MTTTPQTDQARLDTDTFDVLVIGAGPVGENLADYATQGGLSVALIEHELLGGECSYYACMPSKALLRPLQVAQIAQHLPGLTGTTVNAADLLKRRDAWVSRYRDEGQVRWAESAGITVVRGHGELTGDKTVEVISADGTTRILKARRAVVLATGSQARVPHLYAGLEAWDNRDVTGVIEIPRRLTIVGGGVVAVEAATWMAALGSEVTLLVRGQHLLGRLGAEIEGLSDMIAAALIDLGITLRYGARVADARREAPSATGLGRVHGGEVTLTLDDGQTLVSDELLLATGRTPALEVVGLHTIGLSPEAVLAGEGPDWLHLIGDAAGQVLLTHQGKYRARVLGAALAGQEEYAPAQEVPVPQVIFSQPQVAQVGLTAHQAAQQGHSVATSRATMKETAGTSLLSNLNRGFAELTVDADTGVLLGAVFVGEEAAELLHAATIAVTAQLPVKLLRHAVPAYPTSSEIWLRLLEKLPRELR